MKIDDYFNIAHISINDDLYQLCVAGIVIARENDPIYDGKELLHDWFGTKENLQKTANLINNYAKKQIKFAIELDKNNNDEN